MNHRDAAYDRRRHALGVVTAVSTLVLIFVGGLVTSTGSGLSVPDWPLSYGQLMPPMVGGVFYEHGHRMVASFVGLLTLVLAVWTARAEPRRGVRRLAWLALLAVVLQGLLGGLTVIFYLPPWISIAHACLAQTFLCLAVALAYATSREWLEAVGGVGGAGHVVTAGAAATATVFVQLLLGALMRHTGAGLAIPTFPLAFGRLVPPLDDVRVAVHFAHRVGAVLVAGTVGHLAWRAQVSRQPRLWWLGWALGALVVFQIALGGLAVLTGKAVTPTTLHVATGAAILGGCFLLTLRARRLAQGEAPHVQAAAPAVASSGLKAWS
jgi:cytochrome c oxidase assembly protein subunit 15